MSRISEKSTPPLKLLSSLIVVSMFLLALSSYFLLQLSNDLAVFKLILVNNYSSAHFKPNEGGEGINHFVLPSVNLPEQSKKRQEVACQTSNSSKRLGASKRDRAMACNPNQALLKVYMYDLPPDFHFGLLDWKGSVNQTWPDVSNPNRVPKYPGGLNLQHSIEYWLILDLLLYSNTPNVTRACTVTRVQNPNQADIIFVPFFSSLSYNRYSKLRGKEKVSVNRMLQDKLVEFLKGRDEWNRLGGKDHLIVAHHPNSMLVARRKLGSAMFVLADFGRYPVEIANLEKDVIAPYKHIVKSIPTSNSASFKERPILVYFQGAIYRKEGGEIRQELYYLLKDEKNVHFTFGSVKANGVNGAALGMASSKFCLNIAGDTPSSNRLFDAIASQCVPVIISDEIELPFEDVLDYSEFCIFVCASHAVKKGYLLNLLRGIDQDRWTRMWERLKEIAPHFEYQYPSQPGDAVDMIWAAVFRKISSVQSQVNRKKRYNISQLILKSH